MASTGWMCPRSALASPGRHRPELHQNGIPHFFFYLGRGQLGRAVPGSRGTSPGEPAGAVGALRKAPPRSGPSDANPRRGKGVKDFDLLRLQNFSPSAPYGRGQRPTGGALRARHQLMACRVLPRGVKCGTGGCCRWTHGTIGTRSKLHPQVGRYSA